MFFHGRQKLEKSIFGLKILLITEYIALCKRTAEKFG